MHELAITENILQIVLEQAQRVDAVRVVSINLIIGQLSTVVDDSVQFYWDFISEGTIAQGAQLNFDRRPTQMMCLDCQHAFAPTTETFNCPQCLSQRVRVSQGEELRVESIDVEETHITP